MSYTRFAIGLRLLLNHPTKVATYCLIVFVSSIILNGNAFRLWSLHRDFDRINDEIRQTGQNIASLSEQLKQAKDPAFIERQARDKLDLAGEHDLVFVFAEQQDPGCLILDLQNTASILTLITASFISKSRGLYGSRIDQLE